MERQLLQTIHNDDEGFFGDYAGIGFGGGCKLDDFVVDVKFLHVSGKGVCFVIGIETIESIFSRSVHNFCF